MDEGIIDDVVDILRDCKLYLVAPHIMEENLLLERIDCAILKLLSSTYCTCELPVPTEEFHCFDSNCFCLGQAYYTGKCSTCGKTIPEKSHKHKEI